LYVDVHKTLLPISKMLEKSSAKRYSTITTTKYIRLL